MEIDDLTKMNKNNYTVLTCVNDLHTQQEDSWTRIINIK